MATAWAVAAVAIARFPPAGAAFSAAAGVVVVVGAGEDEEVGGVEDAREEAELFELFITMFFSRWLTAIAVYAC